jgi:Bacterial DNA-binding protein
MTSKDFTARMLGVGCAQSARVQYDLFGMKKEQLARQLAKESGITPGAAADQVDRIVSDILQRVRRGQSASLPGLGTFRSGRNQEFEFDRSLPIVPDECESNQSNFKENPALRPRLPPNRSRTRPVSPRQAPLGGRVPRKDSL